MSTHPNQVFIHKNKIIVKYACPLTSRIFLKTCQLQTLSSLSQASKTFKVLVFWISKIPHSKYHPAKSISITHILGLIYVFSNNDTIQYVFCFMSNNCLSIYLVSEWKSACLVCGRSWVRLPGRVIPITFKWVHTASLPSTWHWKDRVWSSSHHAINGVSVCWEGHPQAH